MTLLLGLPFFSSASMTNGTIDSVYKYAWSNNIGWINFAPTGDAGRYQGLVITDSSVTGYAWSKEYGWINFGPFLNNTGGGVKNTNAGILSGYAWSEKLGWVNFSGVVINSSGQFTGMASGDLVGTINFNLTRCTDCGVKTDWHPLSARSTGGGGLFVGAFSAPIAPVSGFSVLINNGASETNTPAVSLSLHGGFDTKKMAISESPNFENVGQEDYQVTKTWNLSAGTGLKTIYVKFYTQYGQPSQVISASIVLNTQSPVEVKMTQTVSTQFFNPPIIKQSEGGLTSSAPELKNNPEVKPTNAISQKISATSNNIWSIWPIEPIQKFISPFLKEAKFLVLKTNYWFLEKIKLLWLLITNIRNQ